MINRINIKPLVVPVHLGDQAPVTVAGLKQLGFTVYFQSCCATGLEKNGLKILLADNAKQVRITAGNTTLVQKLTYQDLYNFMHNE